MKSHEVALPVDHVSDTAYLVAMYRSYESEREDALFKDPYAAILAAPKAKQLESTIPFKAQGHWMMAVRTYLLDAHITRLLSEGVDTVVNLASGLDTRPYRMDLPKGTHWIEADFPEITEYKANRLASEVARCRLERIALDLSDDIARRQLFNYFDGEAKRTLVITEGLLPYLPEPVIHTLATEIHEAKTVTHWLMDITTPNFLNRLKKQWAEKTQDTKVSLKFAPANGANYFEAFGWQVEAFDSFLDGSEKINRKAPIELTTESELAASAHDSGIALLSRK